MLEDFFKALLSTQGVVAALLFLGLVYQSWQLERARKYRDDMETKRDASLAAEALRRIEAFNEITMVLTEMKGIMGRVTDAVERLDR